MFLDQWHYKETPQGEYMEYELYSGKYSNEYIRYLVGKGITCVAGDYGNHIFNREFHPNIKDTTVCVSYFLEKYRGSSLQNPTHQYSPEMTSDVVREYLKDDSLSKEDREFLEDVLSYYVYDEYDYICEIRNSDLDFQYLQPQYELDPWVDTIIQGFLVMCNKKRELCTTND